MRPVDLHAGGVDVNGGSRRGRWTGGLARRGCATVGPLFIPFLFIPFPLRRRWMLQRKSKILFGLAVSAAAGFGVATLPALVARAQNKPAAAPAAPAAKPTCKLHGKNCCDPAIAAHLPVSAVYSACGES